MVKIICSGGGDLDQTQELDKIAFENINSVLYIPIAWEKDPTYKQCEKWFETLTKKQNIKKIDMLTDLNKNFNPYYYDMIYIGGGNTFKLLKEIKNSKFEQVLKKYLKTNKVLYGGSAGAIILGLNILTTHDNNNCNLKSFEGLNFLYYHSITPHYTKDDDSNINKFIEKFGPVFAIPEESGIIYENGIIKIHGKKSIFLFENNKKKRELKINETYKLSNS